MYVQIVCCHCFFGFFTISNWFVHKRQNSIYVYNLFPHQRHSCSYLFRILFVPVGSSRSVKLLSAVTYRCFSVFFILFIVFLKSWHFLCVTIKKWCAVNEQTIVWKFFCYYCWTSWTKCLTNILRSLRWLYILKQQWLLLHCFKTEMWKICCPMTKSI